MEQLKSGVSTSKLQMSHSTSDETIDADELFKDIQASLTSVDSTLRSTASRCSGTSSESKSQPYTHSEGRKHSATGAIIDKAVELLHQLNS